MLVVQHERERKIVRLASCCTCLAFFSLVCASILPMFVVSSLRGHGKLLIAEFDVDIAVGSGLWKQNVCFGSSQPDEDVLKQFGLTCKGSLQTAHCDNDGLSDKEQDRCDQYLLMQGMESLAVFSTFIASFIGTLARSCSTLPFMATALRLGSIASLAVSVAAASAVVSLVKESDLVDETSFSCSNIFGAELCHGYGPSFGLQWAAIGELLLAMTLQVILLFVSPRETTSVSYQYVTVPLLQPQMQSQGVIIAPPPGQSSRAQIATAVESL